MDGVAIGIGISMGVLFILLMWLMKKGVDRFFGD